MATQLISACVSSDQPATYRICVQGRIKASWTDRFEGMAVTFNPPKQSPPRTILQGTLADQAALMGVLNSLYELRLTVLSVECLSGQSTNISSESDDQ
jgi:hypothetical protein